MCQQQQQQRTMSASANRGDRRSSSGNFLRSSTKDNYYNNNNDIKINSDDNNDEGWKQLDPNCLGDTSGGLINDEDECATRTDKNGKICIWCDAPGNDVFGICATSDQREYIGGYMDCGNTQMENLDKTGITDVVIVE
jgi:hypothetical protein